jgi:hypothetical protein
MRNVGIFYGHLEYNTAIFGNWVVIWHIFLRFGILCQEKSGNPDSVTEKAEDDRSSSALLNRNFVQKFEVQNVERWNVEFQIVDTDT